MNKDLYGKKFELPEEVVNYLQQCYESATGANETTEGYRRNIDLRNDKSVSYQQLKRMKNWFDSYQGEENELPYILNGGHYVKNWVNDTLNSMRDNVKSLKQNKSEVLPNQFIKPHEKNDMRTMNRPSVSHSKTSQKYDTAILENLKRINELINKII